MPEAVVRPEACVQRSGNEGEVAGLGRQEASGELGDAAFRALFEALDEGFCVVEMIFDEAGEAVDYRFVEVNAVFEQQTGLRGARGKTARELVPGLEAHWFETYGRVARTGEPARFVNESKPMDERWFDVYAFRLGGPGSRRVAIHFTDISRRKRVEEELRYRSEQFHTLVEQAPLGVYLVDSGFRIAAVNPAAQPTFGDIPGLIGRDFDEVVRIIWPPEVADEVVRRFRHTLTTGEPFHRPELAAIRADRGVAEYYDWRIGRIPLPDGSFGVVCYFSDVSAQVVARRAIAASEERYRTLFESIDEGFCIIEVLFDEAHEPIDYRHLEVNPAFEKHTGVEDALGRTIRELVPNIEPFWFGLYGGVATTGEPVRYDDRAESMDRWFDVYAFRVGEPHERKVAVLFSDITARKHAEEALRERESQLRHRAHHDGLTGLPNRILFEDRLQQAVAAAASHRRRLAVLFIDLDGFKIINDGLGHAAGDAVLAEGARRLRSVLREGDTIARLHGDEFAAVLPELSDPADAEAVARQLLADLTAPIVVAGKVVSVSASIGVAMYPRDGLDHVALVRAADQAMYRAKRDGKNDVRHFSSSLRASAAERVALLDQLDGAFGRGEIVLRYAPQWDGRTGSISTFAAQLRWMSPVLGEVPAHRFVPLAEERGRFAPIANWSLDACGAFARRLSDRFGMPPRVAIEATPSRLIRPGFLTHVEAVVARHRLLPRQLEFELVLNPDVEDREVLRDSILRLRDLGVRLTLDRLGADTGMMAIILDLPLDGVKLDPELVQRSVGDARVRRGLASLVAMVHDLGLEATAVGVETEAQRELMLELGCERIEGPLVGPTTSASEAEAALREQAVSTLF